MVTEIEISLASEKQMLFQMLFHIDRVWSLGTEAIWCFLLTIFMAGGAVMAGASQWTRQSLPEALLCSSESLCMARI